MCGVVYKSWKHVDNRHEVTVGNTHMLVFASGAYVCVPRDLVVYHEGLMCVIEGYGEFTVKRNKIYTLGESGIVEEEFSKERLNNILDSL